jgi:flavin reductase (DIM6/NTAB) family NADH-FMN oxidoreductase RutF
MAIKAEIFRNIMGHFLSGVTVVTTRSREQIAGMTVSAFCSLSMEPPLVLICIDLNSNTLPLLRESKIFAVNMLSEQQEHLSRGFAVNSAERFEHFCHASYHTAATGSPIIDHSLAFIDARLVAEYPGGDHVIMIGEVQALGKDGQVHFMDEALHANSTVAEGQQNGHLKEEKPLAYYRGQYRHLAEHYHKPSLDKPKLEQHVQAG